MKDEHFQIEIPVSDRLRLKLDKKVLGKYLVDNICNGSEDTTVEAIAAICYSLGVKKGLELSGYSSEVVKKLANERRRTVSNAQIVAALMECKFNKTKAAKRLGITRQQLYRRLKDIDLGDV